MTKQKTNPFVLVALWAVLFALVIALAAACDSEDGSDCEAAGSTGVELVGMADGKSGGGGGKSRSTTRKGGTNSKGSSSDGSGLSKTPKSTPSKGKKLKVDDDLFEECDD